MICLIIIAEANLLALFVSECYIFVYKCIFLYYHMFVKNVNGNKNLCIQELSTAKIKMDDHISYKRDRCRFMYEY